MDSIPRAFARALGSMIQYESEVVQIIRRGERAQVVVLDRKTGRRNAIDADLVICTIPRRS